MTIERADGNLAVTMPARLVLADDHEMVREGLRLLLEHAPEEFEVVAQVGDGRAAVSAAQRHEPDVVVMDVMMPDLNGVDATRQIREASPRTRVVGLSGRQDARGVVDMLRAGARAYVVKQHAFEELVDAVRTVLAGRVYLSPAIASHVVDRMLAPAAEPAAVLTPREREVVQLLAEGLTSKEIASRLFVSLKTVETHRSQIMARLGIRTIAGLTKWAIREGLTSVD